MNSKQNTRNFTSSREKKWNSGKKARLKKKWKSKMCNNREMFNKIPDQFVDNKSLLGCALSSRLNFNGFVVKISRVTALILVHTAFISCPYVNCARADSNERKRQQNTMFNSRLDQRTHVLLMHFRHFYKWCGCFVAIPSHHSHFDSFIYAICSLQAPRCQFFFLSFSHLFVM